MLIWLAQFLGGWFITLGSYFLLIIGLLLLYRELTMGIYRPSKSVSLKGKVVVVTGGNAGVGLETAKGLAARGARVVLGCRNSQRGEEAVRDIIQTTGNDQVVFKMLDLQDLESVKLFAETISREEEKVDILLNNAGISDGHGFKSWAVEGRSYLTKDNLEIVTQTNHFGHFLLTNLLKESLLKAGKSRVINVSSMVNQNGKIELDNINYEKNHQKEALKNNYANSKLMNVLFSVELSKRWADFGVTSYSVHPGFVRSDFFNDYSDINKTIAVSLGYILGKNKWQGAQTSLYACMEPGIENMAGGFFADCRKKDKWCNKQAKDKDLCSGLWTRSEELVGLAKHENIILA